MKQFTIITKDGSKWMRPVNPHEKHLVDEFGLFRNPDHVTFGLNNPDIPYIGSHPEGTTLEESEVREIRQWRNKNINSLIWRDIPDGKHDKWAFVNNTAHLESRVAYTDAESHNRHIRPLNTQNVRPLVNQLVGEEISFSRFVEILNEIANGNQKIV